MPLRGLNPAEPRQVGIGIEEWFRALPNADPPVVHRLFPERMLDRLLPKDGTQPANHVRVGRTAINSPLAHIRGRRRSEEHTSELQSLTNLVCRLLLEKKKKKNKQNNNTIQHKT